MDEERGLRNWVKANRKLMNRGDLKADRVEKFKKLMEMVEKYKRVNQYQNSARANDYKRYIGF